MRGGKVIESEEPESDDEEESWIASDRERAILTKLNTLLLDMRNLARSGEDLRALGTAIRFIEWALDGQMPDDHAQLTIGYRTEDWSEGRWMGLTVNEWAIELGETRSFYGPAGSDRESDMHAVLRPGEPWSGHGVAQWVACLDEVLAHDRTRFSGTLND